MSVSSRDREQARARLRDAGLRATPVRLGVLAVLGASRAPLEAQEVTQRLAPPGADRVTVYRTLNSFVEAGLAHRVDPGDRIFRFGLVPTGVTSESDAARPGTGHAHPHFVCDECGAVECLDDSDVTVQTRSRSAGKQPPTFRVKQHEVLLHGTCGECTDPAAGQLSKPPSKPRPAKKSPTSRKRAIPRARRG